MTDEFQGAWVVVVSDDGSPVPGYISFGEPDGDADTFGVPCDRIYAYGSYDGTVVTDSGIKVMTYVLIGVGTVVPKVERNPVSLEWNPWIVNTILQTMLVAVGTYYP